MKQLTINFTAKFRNIRLVYIAAIVVLMAAGLFSAFYLFSGYEYLAGWWIGLSDCFYEREIWKQNFFTPEVKNQGNLLSAAALLFSISVLIYTILRFRKAALELDKAFSISVQVPDFVLILMAMAANFCLWFWSKNLVPLVGDEVRSALDSVGLHPFQTLSYYMLPNNHILFNLTNNIFFHYAGDKVVTGKIISLTGYLFFAAIAYFWFRKITGSRFFAFFSAILLSLQFPVWAFSFQGRGYEWCNVAGWLAFISLFEYFSSQKKHWLILHAISCIIGYAMVPTFLYFHVALVLYAIFQQFFQRKINFNFWKYQAFTVFFVFLFYLPAFCFSGISAFSESRYIKPIDTNFVEFISLIPIRSYMDYCFSCFEAKPTIAGILLFLSPLLLLFRRRNKMAVKLVLFYFLVLFSVFIVFVLMRRFTYHRALIIQFSILFSMVVYLLCLLCDFVNKKSKTKFTGHFVFLLAVIFSGTITLQKNTKAVNFVMYFSDMNYFHSYVQEGINYFPEGSSIAFSSESYNWRYLAKNRNLNIHHCISGKEDFLVKQEGESYPPIKNYVLVKKVKDYEIYKRLE